MSEPVREKCDLHGNLLVWEKNSQMWKIVSIDTYNMYPMCYGHWAYLPEQPEEIMLSNIGTRYLEPGMKVFDTNLKLNGVIHGVVSMFGEPAVKIEWETGGFSTTIRVELTKVKLVK